MPDRADSGWLPWLREQRRKGVLVYLSSQVGGVRAGGLAVLPCPWMLCLRWPLEALRFQAQLSIHIILPGHCKHPCGASTLWSSCQLSPSGRPPLAVCGGPPPPRTVQERQRGAEDGRRERAADDARVCHGQAHAVPGVQGPTSGHAAGRRALSGADAGGARVSPMLRAHILHHCPPVCCLHLLRCFLPDCHQKSGNDTLTQALPVFLVSTIH